MNFSSFFLIAASVLAVAPVQQKTVAKGLSKGVWPWGFNTPEGQAKAMEGGNNPNVPIPHMTGPLWNGQFPWMTGCAAEKPSCNVGL